jgi:hypothetical protein
MVLFGHDRPGSTGSPDPISPGPAGLIYLIGSTRLIRLIGLAGLIGTAGHARIAGRTTGRFGRSGAR